MITTHVSLVCVYQRERKNKKIGVEMKNCRGVPYVRSRIGERSLNPITFCGNCMTEIKTNKFDEIWCESKKPGCLLIDRPKYVF